MEKYIFVTSNNHFSIGISYLTSILNYYVLFFIFFSLRLLVAPSEMSVNFFQILHYMFVGFDASCHVHIHIDETSGKSAFQWNSFWCLVHFKNLILNLKNKINCFSLRIIKFHSIFFYYNCHNLNYFVCS